MAVVQPSDIATNGEDRLLPQFNKSEKIKGLLKSLLSAAQPTEDTLFQVMQSTGIDTAAGVQMDIIGKLLNVPRGTNTDTEYRVALYAKVAINAANGTPENIIDLVRFATGSQSVKLTEYFPAEVHIQVKGGAPVREGFLDLVSPIGVGSYLSTIPEGVIQWVVSEEGQLMDASVLPEEGDEAGHVIAEETN